MNKDFRADFMKVCSSFFILSLSCIFSPLSCIPSLSCVKATLPLSHLTLPPSLPPLRPPLRPYLVTQNMQDKLVPLLEDGVDVLIYAGDADFICNW